jgi:NAD-dependent dihydropyrimidine dehydrogenase PreA subunit
VQDFRYLDDTAILRLTVEKCVGCGNCELVCPHRIFRVREQKAEILDPNGCMECGACVINCPAGAIYVNPDDGCGCAAYIINSWLARMKGKTPTGCGC